jgi:hypothetical protein
VFGVSVDYLLNDNSEDSSAYKIKDKQLQKYLEEVDNLNEKDKELVKGLIEAVLVKDKVKGLFEKKI